jgi:hypothetical protein
MGDGRDRKPEEKQVKATPIEQAVVANQGGKIETTGKPAEAVLKGVPSNDQLLTSTRDEQVRRLEKAGVPINSATGFPEELSSSSQVRSMIQTGTHSFFADEREKEVQAAVAKRNDPVTRDLIGRNLREGVHYVAATEEAKTDLNAANARIVT